MTKLWTELERLEKEKLDNYIICSICNEYLGLHRLGYQDKHLEEYPSHKYYISVKGN